MRRAVINEYVRTRRLRSSTEIVTDAVPERPAAECLEDRAADQAELWAALGGAQRTAARGACAALLRGPRRPRDRRPARLPGGDGAQPRQPRTRGHAAAGCGRQRRGGADVSKLEDDIGRAMATHDDEAPRAADLLRALEQASPPRRHLGWYVPFMAA